MNWGFAATAFGASLVEFVEAAIILVAAAATAGWAAAVNGALAAAGVLVVATLLLGSLLHLVPLHALQAVIGALLLLFGVKWLAKATYRLGIGWRPKHEGEEPSDPRVAFALSFNGTLLEGAEVVFIVVALGATGRALGSAITGAAVALVLVAVATAFARGPLTRVPELMLKYVVGIMLTSFGTLWLGEALGIHWWGQDASVIWLALGNLAVSALAVSWVRRSLATATAGRANA